MHAVEPNSFIIVLLLLFLHCTKSLSLVWYVHVCLPEHVEEARQILLLMLILIFVISFKQCHSNHSEHLNSSLTKPLCICMS